MIYFVTVPAPRQTFLRLRAMSQIVGQPIMFQPQGGDMVQCTVTKVESVTSPEPNEDAGHYFKITIQTVESTN